MAFSETLARIPGYFKYFYMHMLWIIALTILLLYLIRIFRYLTGWRRVNEFSTDGYCGETSVSIIVPFRNEENNITGLLKDLAKQDYPEKLYEVLFIDDHSEDSTVRIIKNYCSNINNFRLIQLPAGISGKKAGIITGIEKAAGKLIITTDADCRAGKNWISTVISFYLHNDKPGMIIGLVDLRHGDSFFKKFQQLEFFSLIGSGAGAAGISRPVYCNGANLIYEKELYFKYKDPLSETSVSGDDTLFMLKVKKDHLHGIKLLKSKDAIVYTEPQPTIRDFFRQRIRWTSKAKHYKDFDIIYTSIVVFALNLSLCISMVLLFTKHHCLLYPALFAGKTIVDFIFLNAILKFFKKRNLLRYLIVFQIVYPVYIVFTGILGNIIGYQWKNRKYTSSPFLI